ncbi:hypothetical protein FS837_002295, partial [Tulasnella sp. UAMH 9824]
CLTPSIILNLLDLLPATMLELPVSSPTILMIDKINERAGDAGVQETASIDAPEGTNPRKLSDVTGGTRRLFQLPNEL